MDKRFVYTDYAATAPLTPTAQAAMEPFLAQAFGNPNSMYALANQSRRALDAARADIASALNVKPDEIYFTSGGTEADNWALKGVATALASKGKHIVASPLEHHAVLHTLQYLEKELGYEVTYLPADSRGQVAPQDLADALRPDTILATCMMANNEVGTILDTEAMAAHCRERKVLFFTDAVQAVGHIPVDASKYDLLSLSGHKFGGPKGVGALVIKKGVRIPPLLHGGGQERNKRSGTENVPGIVGMAAALREAIDNMAADNARLTALRDKLTKGVLQIPHVSQTGDPIKRLPGLASFVINYIEGESMVLLLDSDGICASSGSACSSGSLDPSHVLLALGLPHEIAHGSLRLSLGDDTTDNDVEYIVEKLQTVVERLRLMSPLKPE